MFSINKLNKIEFTMVPSIDKKKKEIHMRTVFIYITVYIKILRLIIEARVELI
jgi:hypothetical protein